MSGANVMPQLTEASHWLNYQHAQRFQNKKIYLSKTPIEPASYKEGVR